MWYQKGVRSKARNMVVFDWSSITKNKRSVSSPLGRIEPSAEGTALCVGSFDGPHLGHKALFTLLVNEAKKRRILPGAITFKKPLGGLAISTLQERLDCMEEYGIKSVYVVDFSADFARISGSDFFAILKERLNCRFVAEGEDFRCGRGGAFGKKEIEAFCAAHDIECAFQKQVKIAGERVSSSRIRELLAAGDVNAANRMLGRQ